MNSIWEALKKGAGLVSGGTPASQPAGLNTPLTLMLAEETATTSDKGVTLTKVGSLSGHSDRVWCVAWHPSANYFVTCGGDRTARLYARVRKVSSTSGEAESSNQYPFAWECIHTVEGEHQRTVRSASWTADGRRLALSSFDATLSVWLFKPDHAEPMELESIIDGHENEVKGCAWAPASEDGRGDLLATCSRDRTAWVWEANSHGEDTEDAEYECAGVLNGHSQDVKHVCWVPQDRSLLTASYDESVKHWRELRKDDWQCVQTMTAHSGTVWCVAAQPLSTIEVSHDDTGVSAAEDDEETTRAPRVQTKVVPDTAPLVCSGSDDGTIKIWCQLERQASSAPGDAADIDDGTYRRTKLVQVGSSDADGFSNGRSVYSVAWCPPYNHQYSSSQEGVTSFKSSDIIVAASGDDSLCAFKLSRRQADVPSSP